MSEDMRSDVELLNAVLDQAPPVLDRRSGQSMTLSAKLLAHWTGRSLQTVSDYRIGKTNIPVEFWRAILDHCFDMRIVGLILPDCYNIELTRTDDPPPQGGREWFRDAVAAEGEHHEQLKYLCDILGDGRVDELDGGAVQKFHDAYMRHRVRDATLHRAITHAYERAVAAKQQESHR
jgi:hypothetical protein